jgi:DNA segregation ATPase FtsK/SpoIIIE, S-DNA-T family
MSFSSRKKAVRARAGALVWLDRAREGFASPALRAMMAVWTLGAWAFASLSLVSFSDADPPTHVVYPANTPVLNWCGPAGAWFAYGVFSLLGWGAWVLLVSLSAYLWALLLRARIEWIGLRTLGVLITACAAAGLQALLFPSTGPIADLPGGMIGRGEVEQLSMRFGAAGTGLWLLVMLFVGGIVAFDRLVLGMPGWAGRVLLPAAEAAGNATARTSGRFGGQLAVFFSGLWPGARHAAGARARMHDLDDAPGARQRRHRVKAAKPELQDEAEDDQAPEIGESGLPLARLVEAKPEQRRRKKPDPDSARASGEDASEVDDASAVVDDAEDAPGAPQVFDPEALRAKIAKLPIVFGSDNRKVATEEDLRDLQNVVDMPGYKFPGLDLLVDPEENFTQRLESYVREQAEALEAALQQYGIDGEVVGIESGPVITLYDVRLAPGTKVAAISVVQSDIARALKAVNIRIVANQAGRDTVGVEVPNATKEKVRLKELMSKTEAFNKMKLPMFLGKDASGEPLIADLTQCPHMLIAGTTGSGKSVCMNTIIMGFLYTRKPSELKLVLVDPKMVEMSQFKDIPHLMCPVVTDMGKAAAILEWACTKMDERYSLLAEAGCRDIASYNDLDWEELKGRMMPKTPEEEARIPRKLPYMVFVIDELADLMMTNKEVEGAIIRIAQKARAVGIHLILATQRPQANVVTGLIKSNMPCRIAFKVASGMDSRIVLDQKGGELLLGQGDMLYLSPRTSKLMRAQGTLVDDGEIRKVVRFMRDVANPSFERQLLVIRKAGDNDEERILESQNNSSASLAAAQEDPMFYRAVEIVLETGRGSVSLLQRRLAIGYTRSSRLIDLMGIAGIISDHKGSVARDVLITPEEWEAMKAQAQADQAAGKGGPASPALFNESGAATGTATGAAAPARRHESNATTADDLEAATAVEEAPFETDDAAGTHEDEPPSLPDDDEPGR